MTILKFVLFSLLGHVPITHSAISNHKSNYKSWSAYSAASAASTADTCTISSKPKSFTQTFSSKLISKTTKYNCHLIQSLSLRGGSNSNGSGGSGNNPYGYSYGSTGGEDKGEGEGGYYDYPGNTQDYYGATSRGESRDYYSYPEMRDDASDDQDEEENRYNDYRYNQDDRYGDDYGYPNQNYRPSNNGSTHSRKSTKTRSSSTTPSFLPTNIPNIPGITQPNRKIGLTCLASGTILTLLGISLFFNKTLLRLGNICYLIGIPLTIGPGRTMGYFLQPKKARATICLGLGIILVLGGYPVFGIALEIFGLLNLFGNMFPLLMMFLRNIPFVSDLLPEPRNRTKKRNTYYDGAGAGAGAGAGKKDYGNNNGGYYDDRDDHSERYY